MKTIHLQPLIAGRTFPDAGSLVFERIEELMQEDRIVLDLTDVVALPSMFLNMSIGAFIEKYGVELLKQKISFANISTVQMGMLRKYVELFAPAKQQD